MRFGPLSQKPLQATVGRDGRFDLRDANASREGAFKELLLLEKHLSQEGCNECCHKHLFCAIAYLEEARTLRGGDAEDSAMADALTALEPSIAENAAKVRTVRKSIAVRLGYAFKGGPS